MPAISVCCLRSHKALMRQGFTLLEVLVVMALMAMMAGMVAPSVQRSLAAAQERAVASDLTALLDSLPVRAFQQGSNLAVDERMLRQWLFNLPEDWQLVVPQALRYSPVGVAEGGRVRVLAPRQSTMEWVVSPVSGKVERNVADGGR